MVPTIPVQVADRLVDVLQSAEETADLDRHGLLDITRDAPEANTITAVRAKLMVTGHTVRFDSDVHARCTFAVAPHEGDDPHYVYPVVSCLVAECPAARQGDDDPALLRARLPPVQGAVPHVGRPNMAGSRIIIIITKPANYYGNPSHVAGWRLPSTP